MTDWLIFTTDDLAKVEAINNNEHCLAPRLIDRAGHPNLGNHALPASISGAQGYEQFAEILAGLAVVSADAGDLFAPSDD
jgi:hypothetical protein